MSSCSVHSRRSVMRAGLEPEVTAHGVVDDAEDAALQVWREASVAAMAVEVHVDAASPAAVDRRPAQRGHQPKVVEDHGSDVEDELLGGLERVLHHAPAATRAPGGPGVAACHQALHDLGLERDVGEALRRPVVHLAGDLPAELLLGAQERLRTAPRPGARRGRAPRGAAAAGRSGRAAPAPGPGAARRSRIALQGPLLAFEHLLLRLEERRASAQRQQLARASRELGHVRAWVALDLEDALLGLDAAALMALGLGRGLLRQQRDLVELPVELRRARRRSRPGSWPCRCHRPPARDRRWSLKARSPPGQGGSLPDTRVVNPRGSGSSPASWRTRPPGSGRSPTACAGWSSCGS